MTSRTGARRRGRSARDEDLAEHVGVLLVAAHEPDHAPARGLLDDGLEAVAHDLLERHPLEDHLMAAAGVAQRLLDAREAAAQQADDEIVLVVGLRARRTPAVELLEERDDPVGDGGENLAAPPARRLVACCRRRVVAALAHRPSLALPFGKRSGH